MNVHRKWERSALALVLVVSSAACAETDEDPHQMITPPITTYDAGAVGGTHGGVAGGGGVTGGGSLAGGGTLGGALPGGGAFAGGALPGGGTFAGGALPGGLFDGGLIGGAAGGAVGDSGPIFGNPMPDAGAGDASTPSAGACSGKPGMRRGKSEQTLMSGGLSRSFIYYAPANLNPNQAVPLVIVPHGTNMSGEGMYVLTDYAKLADREGFVAIFPDGEDGPGSLVPWNVGDGICGLGAFVAAAGNDQGFVDDLIKFAQADQCIDEQHIFMSGFSMGGYFSNETGCMNPKIRAVGPHSGGSHDLGVCKNQRKPVIVFHFEGDSLIDYACGSEARDRWVKRNGCNPSSPDVVQVKGGRCEYFKGCPADGQVAMCSFTEGDLEALPPGHGWSGGKTGGPQDFAAITSTESATELGWAFFKKYAW